MSVLDELRAGMRALLSPPPPPPWLKLFVSPVSFDRGEAWCREAFGVGPDVEIVESLPLPLQGEEARTPRRYPSALEGRRS